MRKVLIVTGAMLLASANGALAQNFEHFQTVGGTTTSVVGTSNTHRQEWGAALEVKQYSDIAATMQFNVSGGVNNPDFSVTGFSGSTEVDPLNVFFINTFGFNAVTEESANILQSSWQNRSSWGINVNPFGK